MLLKLSQSLKHRGLHMTKVLWLNCQTGNSTGTMLIAYCAVQGLVTSEFQRNLRKTFNLEERNRL